MVCFSALYGIISFSCGYYGEMATYLGMTAPMAVFALVSWLRNPYQGNRAEVQVRRLERRCCLDADPDRGSHSSVLFHPGALHHQPA